ncbi:hypothetical protein ACIPSE_45020 [Streptomyces sp. NPDC090106]|uniref:hypothetical protein n=1 Tax=Streptomyces sp. NPDC090106 TaxID=3365946 RepID=UPI003811306D
MRSTTTSPRAAAVVAAVLSVLLVTAPSAPTAVAAPAAAPCASKWKATKRVAVRRPAWNEGPIATTRSPVVGHLRKGKIVRSCVVGVGRDSWSEYSECGGGRLWRIVPGGQVPASCLKRVRTN